MSPSLLLTRRQQYGAFHEALDSLYSADRLTLAQDNMPDTANLQGLFDALADMIYKDGRFTVSQLRSKEARRVIAETANVLAEGVNTQLPTDVSDTLRYALEENTFTFSGFKTFHAMREIGLSLVAEDGNIKPFSQFKEDVKAVNDSYNVNYLRAEYQQAVGASQMAAKWVDIERDGDRYDLQYRTAQDNRVREDHALLHGTTLPPSDPFWDKYYPPNGWGCRCTVVQVRHGKYPLSDPELAMKRGDNSTAGVKQQMFRFNPGKQMKLFPPKHPYYPKNCDGCDKNGLRLAYNPQSEKCRACQAVAHQTLCSIKNDAVRRMKEAAIPAYKSKDSRFVYGRMYCGNKDRKNVIQHVEAGYMIPSVINIDNILDRVSNGQTEELVEAHMNDAKKQRHVIKYTKYIFSHDVIINGQKQTKMLQLKCEVIQNGHRLQERPYSIKELR